MLVVPFCLLQGLQMGGSGDDYGQALDDDEGKY